LSKEAILSECGRYPPDKKIELFTMFWDRHYLINYLNILNRKRAVDIFWAPFNAAG